MKETGIIMSGNHPKLILDGVKTQTRRVIKLKGYHRKVWDFCIPHNVGRDGFLGEPYLKVLYDEITDNAGTRITCPYGQVGDMLWVRETFWHPPLYVGDKKDTSIVCYKANLEPHQAERQIWKPSIFMPRWASRITLEITELRAERLQEISIDDAFSEGTPMPYERGDGAWNDPHVLPRFQKLWDSLNAKRGYSWESNPWVWVIGFANSEVG